ncbi:MAG: AtpZ/AtpI family protein [Chloroflexia bacterium]
MKLDQGALQAWALAGEVGCSLGVFLGGSVIGGILLDRAFDTRPIFLLVGIFLGLALAAYSMYRLVIFRSTGSGQSSSRSSQDDE